MAKTTSELADFDPFVPELKLHDQVVDVHTDYHGTVYVVTALGRIFHRIPDPTPATRPGPVGYVWREIEGPAL